MSEHEEAPLYPLEFAGAISKKIEGDVALLSGLTVPATSLLENKFVMLNFFATW